MLRYLGLTSESPFFRVLGEVAYYSLACAAGLLVLYKLHKRLLDSGYDEKKLTTFVFLCVGLGIPATFLGSRAAGMFYNPIDKWSLDLLLESIRSGGTHTFHASIILLLIVLSILTLAMKYRYLEVMDTVFLYVPIGHAIGRVACLIVGCCWGRSVSLAYFGFHTRFVNPAPLYSILCNIAIFYFLKRIYDRTYLSEDTRRRYEGSVIASYLVLYGIIRIILEVFRREKRILFALTQAQIVMIFFILVGLIIFAIIQHRSRKRIAAKIGDTGVEYEVTRLFCLLGVVVSYLALIFAMYHLTRKLRIFEWPFRSANSVGDAYSRIATYLPMMLLPLVSVYWLRRIDFPILQKFKWQRFSKVFYIGLIVGIYYAVDVLALKGPRLRGFEYWPPVLILSAMNAISEETIHRLAVFNLFRSADYSKFASIVMQGVVYSVVHFMISPTLGVLSLIYGCLLGILMDRTGSVTPCIICHFVVDIGGIGRPLLSY